MNQVQRLKKHARRIVAVDLAKPNSGDISVQALVHRSIDGKTIIFDDVRKIAPPLRYSGPLDMITRATRILTRRQMRSLHGSAELASITAAKTLRKMLRAAQHAREQLPFSAARSRAGVCQIKVNGKWKVNSVNFKAS